MSSKIGLGLLCIIAGVLYGCLIIDSVYNATLGYLVEHKYINPPPQEDANTNPLGRKTTIIFYSLLLILIGLFLLWNH